MKRISFKIEIDQFRPRIFFLFDIYAPNQSIDRIFCKIQIFEPDNRL